MNAMVKKLLRNAGGVVAPLSFLIARYAFAQGVTLPNPLSASTFNQVVSQVIGFLIAIAIPLTAIMALIGGLQMITANGDPEKFTNGRKTLMYAAIGFAVVVLASGVVAIISNIL